MNISRTNTPGGSDQDAAGRIQRAKAATETKAPADVKAAKSTEAPSGSTASSTGLNHPRLAAYANKIDARLSLAIESHDMKPRQKAALEKAKEHFHGMIQRLDQAFEHEASAEPRQVLDDLDHLLDYFAGGVNHIRAGGGKIDTTA